MNSYEIISYLYRYDKYIFHDFVKGNSEEEVYKKNEKYFFKILKICKA